VSGLQMDLFRRPATGPNAEEGVKEAPTPLGETLEAMGNLVAFAQTAPDGFWKGMKLDD